MTKTEMIDLWRSVLKGQGKPWVAFENGTCVMLSKPGKDVAAQAKALLQEFGPATAGSSFGDFGTIKLGNGAGWLVTSHHDDILTLVGPEEAGNGGPEIVMGLVGRTKRDQDAAELRIIHIEDTRQASKTRG